MNKIYIIVKYKPNLIDYDMIESVWDSLGMAESALVYHADKAKIGTHWYRIIERRLNSRMSLGKYDEV